MHILHKYAASVAVVFLPGARFGHFPCLAIAGKQEDLCLCRAPQEEHQALKTTFAAAKPCNNAL